MNLSPDVVKPTKDWNGCNWIRYFGLSLRRFSLVRMLLCETFFFIVVNMTTELLLLNEQTHLSACVCAVWIGTSFSDFNSIAIIPLFSIHWKYFCATFCQSSLVFLGSYRPHLTPRCFSLRKKKSLNQDETQMQNQFFQSNSQLDSIEITIVKRNVWQIRILIFICRSICFQLAQMYPELVSRVILSSLLNKRAFSSALTTKALFLSWSGFIFLRVPFDSNGCVCVCLCTFGKMLAEWFSHHKRWAHFSFHARIICVYYIDSNGLIIYMAD